ncbi:MAG: hypothetical protein M1830_006696 [Pleopsidium flavum]|nr:MAG: hypothetical protein M1830_006696 [Pleopsidium flavum]
MTALERGLLFSTAKASTSYVLHPEDAASKRRENILQAAMQPQVLLAAGASSRLITGQRKDTTHDRDEVKVKNSWRPRPMNTKI